MTASDTEPRRSREEVEAEEQPRPAPSWWPEIWPPGDRRWLAAAALIFTLAGAVLFRGYLGQNLTEVVPANIVSEGKETAASTNWDPLAETDLRFVVWLIARNAWTIVHRPLSLFDAEQCYPAPNALAFGEPGIGLGFLAAPIRLVVGDPVATFNLTLLAMTAIAAFAMFGLVREWTGSPPAGIVAGLLYAFHVLKIGDVVHVIIWDTAWTVLALYFATRLFARGGWGATAGLAVATSMQITGSLYPLLAAAVLALPFLVWLLRCYGVSNPRPAQLAALAAWLGLVVAGLATPYLQESATGGITETPFQVYRPLSYLLPGGVGFSGWMIWLLALVALSIGRPAVVSRLGGDPRLALLIGGLLIFSMSVVGEGGPGEATFPVVRGQAPPEGFPNLYLALSRFIPGLDVVRGPGAMYGGVHLVLCVLAGIGASALIARVPRHLAVVAVAGLIVLAAIDTLRPGFLGLAPRIDYRMFELAPSDDALELFSRLETSGDRGPLLEYPVNRVNFWKASQGLLLTAYHHRATSYCYNSFTPPVYEEVEGLSRRLPATEPLATLREMGFRTLLVHHGAGELGAALHRERFARFAASDGAAVLRRLHGNDSLTAYRILP